MIIVLNASLETILMRIKKCNRHFEQNINPQYLQTLIDSYHDYTLLMKQNHENIPIIEINSDTLDFVANPEDLSIIIEKIEQTIKEN